MEQHICVNDGDSDGHGSTSDYEPEYEVETVSIGSSMKLHVMCLLPPPVEYISALRSQQKEISGRQVWTGSHLLANVFCQDKYKGMFDSKRVLELGSGTGTHRRDGLRCTFLA
jgi:hypothetical protein